MSMLIMPPSTAPSRILLVPPRLERKPVRPVFSAPTMGPKAHMNRPMKRTPTTG